MRATRTVLPLFIMLFAALPVFAQEAEPAVKTTRLTDTLYVLKGRGGNVMASVGDDGALLIDDDYAQYAAAYAAALAKLGHAQPRFVINTHWHGDHTGGNAHWSAAGAVIVAHGNVLQRMSTDQESAFLERVTPASPKQAWPVVTYAESLALHFNGDTIEVQHYPSGHTDGDSIVFFQKANVVHMGDHYFKDRFPFVDIGSGGRVENFILNIAAVMQLVDEATVIVPGHGDATASKADLQRYYSMLINTRAEVQEMQAEGLSLEQMQARGLDKRWESWGKYFIKQEAWISFLASGT